jgi:mono/diheme cytochrome c family protein
MKTSRLAPFICALAAAASTHVASAQSSPTGAREITFTADIAPIIFNHCTSCHRPGENAPFSLLGFDDVRPRARQIAAVTASRQMPPWKAAPGDYAFNGDRRLSDAQVALIQRWVESGMHEGDRAKLPPLPVFTAGWQLGEPDLVVTMPEAYDVPATGRDIYRSFVLPLNLSADVYVKAVDFRPSARSVVHHSLFFTDTSGEARRRDAADPVPGFAGGMGGGLNLGGGRGLFAALGRPAAGRGRGPDGDSARADDAADRGGRSSTGGLGGWVPGSQPRMLPDDLAFFLPKGADLVLSTHFHPSGRPASEASTVGLYFAKRPPTKAFTAVQLPPVFGLLSGIDIPAGESRYTITDSFVLPVDVKAFGASGHAHYLAKTMKMTATLPGGAASTLIEIPDWDFGWQEQYQFAEYVPLPKGTRLDVTITYDNSAGNRRNPSSPPKRVTWGEQSTDEMGSVSLHVIAAHPGELPDLQQALGEHIREVVSRDGGLGRLLQLGRGRAGSGAQR